MFGIKIDNCLWMSGMCVVLLGNFSLFGTVLQEGPPAAPPILTLGSSDVPGWGALFLKGAHLTGWSQGGVLPFTRF